MLDTVLPSEASPPRHAPAGIPRWARAACRMAGGIAAGRLTLVLPGGIRHSVRGALPGPDATLVLHRPRAALRMLFGGAVGLGEGYVAGDWDTPDLRALLTLGAMNRPLIEARMAPRVPLRALHRLVHCLRPNTRRGSRRNVARHYDLGNDFYACWLDPTLSYSSGLFLSPKDDLEAAQRAKYRRIADLLDLRPGHRVLEIGCGWGGFAELAARERGCRVVGLTVSEAQAAHARERVARAGLAGQVDIRLEDYRDTRGRFDRVVSIEMFEAVGEAYWPRWFETVRERLVPGGRAGVQVITIADDRFEAYRRRADFIQRHVFPGGMLPSDGAFRQGAAAEGLSASEPFRFGADYARTLSLWHARFEEAWPTIAGLGFDERFRRMWRFYLAYCEAGFATGAIDVCQYVLNRPSGSAAS